MKKKIGIWIAVVIVIIILVGWLFLRYVYVPSLLSGVYEGVVNYDNCKEKITIQEENAPFWIGAAGDRPTCNYRKTISGKVMAGGTCVILKKDWNGACEAAYIYSKSQSPGCENSMKNGVSYPFLGRNDLCYTIPQ